MAENLPNLEKDKYIGSERPEASNQIQSKKDYHKTYYNQTVKRQKKEPTESRRRKKQIIYEIFNMVSR